jgi:hypothetical protein
MRGVILLQILGRFEYLSEIYFKGYVDGQRMSQSKYKFIPCKTVEIVVYKYSKQTCTARALQVLNNFTQV